MKNLLVDELNVERIIFCLEYEEMRRLLLWNILALYCRDAAVCPSQ